MYRSTTNTIMNAFEIYTLGTRVYNGNGIARFQYNGVIARCYFENGEYIGGTILFDGVPQPEEEEE